ncbi:hypothetical protein Tco_1369117 [Tanacetum coccineum]
MCTDAHIVEDDNLCFRGILSSIYAGDGNIIAINIVDGISGESSVPIGIASTCHGSSLLLQGPLQYNPQLVAGLHPEVMAVFSEC